MLSLPVCSKYITLTIVLFKLNPKVLFFQRHVPVKSLTKISTQAVLNCAACYDCRVNVTLTFSVQSLCGRGHVTPRVKLVG